MENNIIWVADFKLINGRINNCLVWRYNENEEKLHGINLERFEKNPIKLLEFEKLHIQNSHTAIAIDTKDIKSINIRSIEESEW